MLDFKNEEQLCEPISRFLKNKQFSYICYELNFFEYRIDLFAYSNSSLETISVELKLRNWKKALQQALIYQLCSDYVYIGIPKSFLQLQTIEKMKQFGVGIIAVYPSGYCKTILKSQKSLVLKNRYKTRFIESAEWEHIK